jgi:hypothetical protein
MFQRVLPSLGRLLGRKKRLVTRVEERRVWVRHPCRLETTVHAASDGDKAPLSARVRNVSRGGIMLVVNQPIAAGDLVSVEVPTDSEPSKGTFLACVLHVHAEAENEWALSCSFAAELSDGELRQFGISSVTTGGEEQRALIRYPCRAQAAYEVVGCSAEHGYASVVNVSVGGIGLSTIQPIAVGTLLNLDLRDSTDRVIATMLASVVSTRPGSEGEFLLGCNFLGELSEAQLRDLV